MSRELTILRGSRGLDTKDHPAELQSGGYLAKAVNVDISDKGSVCRRKGFTVASNGYTNAHSLFGFLNRYAMFVDGSTMFRFDTSDDTVSAIVTNLTAGLPVSYTVVADMLIYTNGLQRGVITETEHLAYDAVFAVQDTDLRQINSFPVGDMIHFFNGSIYGGIVGEPYLYGSEPYKLNCYDQLRGYIMLGSPLRWIKSVALGLLVGTDKGITAFVGKGLADFQEQVVLPSRAITCSEYTTLEMASDQGRTVMINGVLALVRDGVFFITDQLEQINMTSKLKVEWGSIAGGSFGQADNSYIFSGVTT